MEESIATEVDVLRAEVSIVHFNPINRIKVDKRHWNH